MSGWKSLSPDEDGYYGNGAMQEAPKEPVLYLRKTRSRNLCSSIMVSHIHTDHLIASVKESGQYPWFSKLFEHSTILRSLDLLVWYRE